LTVDGFAQEMGKPRTLFRIEGPKNLVLERLLRGFRLVQRLSTLFGHRHNVSPAISGIASAFYEARRLQIVNNMTQ
jgi:hypothetical protein